MLLDLAARYFYGTGCLGKADSMADAACLGTYSVSNSKGNRIGIVITFSIAIIISR